MRKSGSAFPPASHSNILESIALYAFGSIRPKRGAIQGIFRSHSVISSGGEKVLAFAWREGVEGDADGFPQIRNCSRGSGAQNALNAESALAGHASLLRQPPSAACILHWKPADKGIPDDSFRGKKALAVRPFLQGLHLEGADPASQASYLAGRPCDKFFLTWRNH